MANQRKAWNTSQAAARRRRAQALAKAKGVKPGAAGSAPVGIGQGSQKPGGPMPHAPVPGPPPMSYDPALDYQGNSAAQGYGWQLQDYAPGGKGTIEIGGKTFDLQTPGRLRTRGIEDFGIGNARLDRSQIRGDEDYAGRTSALGRSFSQLASNQAQGAAQRGVTSSGLAAQSRAKRSENQALAQGEIDQSKKRFDEDIGDARGDLTLGFNRQWGEGGDADTQLLRGGLSLGDFLKGLETSKLYESGYVAPAEKGKPQPTTFRKPTPKKKKGRK